ncbi:MAG: methyltransferase domain-containing protein [Acidobacteriia bacterium]|nr:methyltransferase domain-containing protein [Terriglobia bacterium]
MRRKALSFFACPCCASDLTLRTDEPPDSDGHILAGELACSGCSLRFPIRDGVPVLLPDDVEEVKLETASRFADEWLHWSDLRDYYEQEFFAWLAPLTAADFAGRTVFEGGCGKGRHTAIVAAHGAKAIVSIDLGQSAFVAFAHTRHLPNAHVVIGDLLQPPVHPVFDLAFSVGVLHHLPDPAAGFASLASRVRDGGRVAFWVYGQEGNEWITRYVDPVRTALTSKLPARLLRAACVPPSAFLWGAIKLFYRPRADGKGPAKLPYGDYFASMYDYPFDEIHANVFDQLVTPVAHYLRGDEVLAWVASGFYDVAVRSHRGYSWSGLATVDRSSSGATASYSGPERGVRAGASPEPSR